MPRSAILSSADIYTVPFPFHLKLDLATAPRPSARPDGPSQYLPTSSSSYLSWRRPAAVNLNDHSSTGRRALSLTWLDPPPISRMDDCDN